jgi:hypothetical protein
VPTSRQEENGTCHKAFAALLLLSFVVNTSIIMVSISCSRLLVLVALLMTCSTVAAEPLETFIRNTANADCTGVDNPCQVDVVVIGAGWAGLSTAAGLAARGRGKTDNVVVLEADKGIGGRCWTQDGTFKEGHY